MRTKKKKNTNSISFKNKEGVDPKVGNMLILKEKETHNRVVN